MDLHSFLYVCTKYSLIVCNQDNYVVKIVLLLTTLLLCTISCPRC